MHLEVLKLHFGKCYSADSDVYAQRQTEAQRKRVNMDVDNAVFTIFKLLNSVGRFRI